MPTKPQDVLVALKLSLGADQESYAAISESLGMSASEVHAAVRRLGDARLIDPESKQIRRDALRNFLVHGVPYCFPAVPREITRGFPTAWAAPVMAGKIGATDQIPPVWPDPSGKTQGAAVAPLYPSAPQAARKDAALYELLALVDALRIGRARERNMAEKELSKRLSAHVAA